MSANKKTLLIVLGILAGYVFSSWIDKAFGAQLWRSLAAAVP